MKTAFISHASEDEAVAGTISAYLERTGVSCWIAPRDVRPGADYASEIIDGIESSAVFVLVLSEHANTSGFVKREVERAVSKGKPVFPVRVREVVPSKSLELFISSAEWVDAWHPPIEPSLERLATSIRSATSVYSGAAAGPTAGAGRAVVDEIGKAVTRTSDVETSRSRRPVVAAVGVGVVAILLVWGVMRMLTPAPTMSGSRATGGDPPKTMSTTSTTSGASSSGGAPASAAASGAAPAGNAAAPAEATPPTVIAGADVAASGLAPTDPCPRALSINPSLPTPFSCTCSAEATAEGAVWGTDVYTDDSGLCHSAVHAGVLTPKGGLITVTRNSGRQLYVGSMRNGVQSYDYGSATKTIEFKGTPPAPSGPGLCPRALSINRELPVPFTCRCTDEGMHSGAVWGTDIYTEDSGICRAALHAGRLTPAGGAVTVMRSPGRPLYVGTLRNGIQSYDYGQAAVSVTFK